jgi:hypothetical protein
MRRQAIEPSTAFLVYARKEEKSTKTHRNFSETGKMFPVPRYEAAGIFFTWW